MIYFLATKKQRHRLFIPSYVITSLIFVKQINRKKNKHNKKEHNINKKDTRNKKWIHLTHVAKGTNFITKLFNKKQTSMYPYEINVA